MSCERTCNGDCCVVVGTAFSYRELVHGTVTGRTLRDRETLADMLVPITYEQARERLRTMTSGYTEEHHPSTQRHYYTCNRWDEETRLCTRYDERPEMCSAYPYDVECSVPGCEYTPPQDVIDKWINGKVTP